MRPLLTPLHLWFVMLVLGTGLSGKAVAGEGSAAPPQALQDEPSKSSLFLAAQTAYDEGRYTEAEALYGQLTSNGVDNVELHYNRANACFKSGDLPNAVLYYRRAWYRAPRDPDIRANLHFALNAAGATETVPSIYNRLFTVLSRSEWVGAAVAGYAALALLLILSLLIRPARRILLRTSLLPALLMLLALGGWQYWRQLEIRPEWVVVRTGATALFGPIDGTTAHYKVPRGALVRQLSTDPKGWIEIEYDNKKGWLKKQYIKRVYP